MSIFKPYITDPKEILILENKMHGRLKYTLMNDFLSKYSFQKDVFALSGFLAALLRINAEDITNIEILNPIEPSEAIHEKDCIMDIKLELNHTKIINIEFQTRFQEFWAERTITYLARIYDQLNTGESYNRIQPCIHIGIHSNNIFKKDDSRYTEEFYSEYRLLNTKTHTEYSSKFDIRVLLLNQLENASDEDKANPNGLYRWARLFRATTWEDFVKISKENPYMESLSRTVRKLSQDEKIALASEARRRYSNELATYEESIAAKEALLADKDAEIADKDAALADKDAALADKDAEIARLKRLLGEQSNGDGPNDTVMCTLAH